MFIRQFYNNAHYSCILLHWALTERHIYLWLDVWNSAALKKLIESDLGLITIGLIISLWLHPCRKCKNKTLLVASANDVNILNNSWTQDIIRLNHSTNLLCVFGVKKCWINVFSVSVLDSFSLLNWYSPDFLHLSLFSVCLAGLRSCCPPAPFQDDIIT